MSGDLDSIQPSASAKRPHSTFLLNPPAVRFEEPTYTQHNCSTVPLVANLRPATMSFGWKIPTFRCPRRIVQPSSRAAYSASGCVTALSVPAISRHCGCPHRRRMPIDRCTPSTDTKAAAMPTARGRARMSEVRKVPSCCDTPRPLSTIRCGIGSMLPRAVPLGSASKMRARPSDICRTPAACPPVPLQAAHVR